MEHEDSYKEFIPPIVLLSVIALIFLIITFRTNIKNQLNSWKLLPQPERLTELYFTHPNNLTSTYEPGQAQNVAFTVHNIEYQTENYKYTIVEQDNNGNNGTTLATGSFTLSQNQYKNASQLVTPIDLGDRARISVKLVTVNESIDYWVNKGSA